MSVMCGGCNVREIERVSERASEREREYRQSTTLTLSTWYTSTPVSVVAQMCLCTHIRHTEGMHVQLHLLFVKPPRVAFVEFVRLLVVAKALFFFVPGRCRHGVHEDLRLRLRSGVRCAQVPVLGRLRHGVQVDLGWISFD